MADSGRDVIRMMGTCSDMQLARIDDDGASGTFKLTEVTATEQLIAARLGGESLPSPDGVLEARTQMTRALRQKSPGELAAAFGVARRDVCAAVERLDESTLQTVIPGPLNTTLGILLFAMGVEQALGHVGFVVGEEFLDRRLRNTVGDAGA